MQNFPRTIAALHGQRKLTKQSDGSALDFEAQLWAAADTMRGHMDASEYKHVCLGLIFLKYISDAFGKKREQLLFGFSNPKTEWFIKDEPQRADAAENRAEYLAANVFWLPPEARWQTIKARAKSPEIGQNRMSESILSKFSKSFCQSTLMAHAGRGGTCGWFFRHSRAP